jgi:Flp pilus assembly CpaF family ATPase
LNSSHFHRLALRRDTTIFSGFTSAYRIQLLDNPTPQAMVESGYITAEAMQFLQRCVEAEVSILVAGEAGSAKTTLLRALARSIPRSEPILTVEESPELFLRMATDGSGNKYFSNVHDHIIQTSADGEVVGFADILKWALQESCRRMIVGEIPNGEIMSHFLTALSGHGSGMATLHASNIDNVIPRITTLLSAYGMPQLTAWSQIQDNLAVVVHAQLQHNESGIQRFVTGIGWVVPSPASADAPPKILNAFVRDNNGQLVRSTEAVRVMRNLTDAERRTKGVAGPGDLTNRVLITE